MKPIQLFGTSTQSYASVFSAQRRLNVFYEVIQDGEKNVQLVFRGTPGTELKLSLPEGPIRGWIVEGNQLYVVAGSGLYQVAQDLTYLHVGQFKSNTGKVSLASNGFQILIATGGDGYVYEINKARLTKITSPGYPKNASSVAFLNGFFLVNEPDTSNFWMSELYDGLTWNPLNFAKTETNPDNLVAVDANHGTLVLWGESSIEFWQNTGAYPFPFSQIVGTAQDWGLAAFYSRAKVANSIAFLAKNTSGQTQVMALNQYTPVRISTPEIENIISGFGHVRDAIAIGYSIDGHPFYQLTFPTANRTFLYDFNTQAWSEMQTGLTTNRHMAELSVAFNNQIYVSESKGANLFSLDKDVYTDNNKPIKRQLTSKHVESNGESFSIDELWLDMQLGTGPLTGNGSNPVMMLEVSKDSGRTYKAPRTVEIAKTGQYGGPRAIWRRIGQSRDFVFRFTSTDPIEFNVVRGSLTVRKGSQ